MDENYIAAKVIEILKERNPNSALVIERETRLFEIGDSLDRVEAIMELEDEFEISIADTVEEKITTVGELIEYVERLSRVAATAEKDATPAEDVHHE